MIITAKALVATVVAGVGLLTIPVGGDAAPTEAQATQPCPSVGLPALFAPMQN
jgi:hypothetical protein